MQEIWKSILPACGHDTGNQIDTHMEAFIRQSGAPFALAMRRIMHGIPPEEAVKVWKISKTTVAEGVVACPKCKSKRVWEKSMQTRSADEGATSFFTCSECKYQWKF